MENNESVEGCFDLAGLMKMFDFSGKTVAITGGTGVLCSEMASALAGCGAQVAILGRDEEAFKALVERMGERGKQFFFFKCSVIDRESVFHAAQEVIKSMGKLDCLINGAGGNKPQATTSAEVPFFDLPADALRGVLDLNVLGTILPCQAFGKIMADQGYGTILNISSMNAFRPLTRIRRLLGCKGRSEQLHAMAGRAHGTGILAEDPRERHCARIFPHPSKPFSANRQRNRRMDRARQGDRRAHADGAAWRIKGSVWMRAVAAFARLRIRNRRSDSSRWRFFRFQRRVIEIQRADTIEMAENS